MASDTKNMSLDDKINYFRNKCDPEAETDTKSTGMLLWAVAHSQAMSVDLIPQGCSAVEKHFQPS